MNHGHFPAWHNGKFCQTGDLSISVQDLGLLRSYGVYDVVSVKNNWALAIDKHIDRFLQGCAYYYITIEQSADDLLDLVKQLSAHAAQDIHVWLIATRGTPQSYGMHDVLNATPNVMLASSPWTSITPTSGIRLCIARTVCRIPDSSINQAYKNFARQDFTMAQIESAMRGFDHPVLLDHNGYLTEAPQCSVAIIKDSTILAPAQNRLSGITMNLVHSLCKENDIDFQYCDISEELVNQADDAFVTTTAGGIISVAMIEKKHFVETALQQKIRTLYQQAWTQQKYSVNFLCS